MDDAGIESLRQAIRGAHGCEPTYVSSELVHETFGRAAEWAGEVTVFSVAGHPSGAERCYAWTHATDGGPRKFYTVLGLGPVVDAKTAVGASIAVDSQGGR